jgi:hypothetical protein
MRLRHTRGSRLCRLEIPSGSLYKPPSPPVFRSNSSSQSQQQSIIKLQLPPSNQLQSLATTCFTQTQPTAKMKTSMIVSVLSMAVMAFAAPYASEGASTTCSNTSKQVCCDNLDLAGLKLLGSLTCTVQLLGSACENKVYCCETESDAVSLAALVTSCSRLTSHRATASPSSTSRPTASTSSVNCPGLSPNCRGGCGDLTASLRHAGLGLAVKGHSRSKKSLEKRGSWDCIIGWSGLGAPSCQ